MVVAPNPGGASRANSPRPVGKMYSSPRVNRTKYNTSHSQLARPGPACESHRREQQIRGGHDQRAERHFPHR